jgi:hypothetical protein
MLFQIVLATSLLIAPIHLSAQAFEVHVGPGVTESQENTVINGLGDSFQYFENAFGYRFQGPANAYVSSDPTFLATAMVRERRISNWLAEATREWTNNRENEAAYGHLLMRSSGSAFRNGKSDVQRMLAHEAFHLIQYELVGAKSKSCCDQERVSMVGPTWLMEGSAEYAMFRQQSAVHGQNLSRMLNRSKAAAQQYQGSLASLEVGNQFYAVGNSYSIGAFATHMLVEIAGPSSIPQFYLALRRSNDWKRAFEGAFGLRVEEFYLRFDEV